MHPSEQERRALACPHCTKTFGDPNGLYSHVKAKHGKKAARPLKPVSDREQSMGELVAGAQADRAMGLSVDPWIEEVFGDYI